MSLWDWTLAAYGKPGTPQATLALQDGHGQNTSFLLWAVWAQVEGDMKSNNRTFADEDTTEEEARADYRRIAERRVRLGLVLAQIGEKSDIKISDDEVTQALVERVRQYPGQEKQVWDFYRKNPQALAEIRAPLFEDKVCDFIFEQVKLTDQSVSIEELMKEPDDEAETAPVAA